jgi:hypothetical protein
MKTRAVILAVALPLAAWLVATATPPAVALTLHGDYFVIGSANPDVNNGVDPGVQTGLVSTTLTQAPLDAPTKASNPPVSKITDLNGSSQIQWWTAHGSPPPALGAVGSYAGVIAAGSRSDNSGSNTSLLPASFSSNMFAGAGQFNSGASCVSSPATPCNGGSNGYLAVHWTGAVQITGTPTLSLSSDDDAWLFVHRQGGAPGFSLLLDSGGVHGGGSATNLFPLSTGVWDLELFWADRQTWQGGLSLLCAGEGQCSDPPNTVPEPATLMLFGSTLVGLGAVVRRRMRSGAKHTV